MILCSGIFVRNFGECAQGVILLDIFISKIKQKANRTGSSKILLKRRSWQNPVQNHFLEKKQETRVCVLYSCFSSFLANLPSQYDSLLLFFPKLNFTDLQNSHGMSKRFFINNLDTKFGQALLDQLNKQASDDPIHMCTMRDPNLPKPKGIKKILKRQKPKLSRKKMLQEADVIIYNVEQTDIKDIAFGLEIFDKAVESEKVFILVSNIMSWSDSEKKVKVEKKPEPELNQDGTVKEEENKEDPVVPVEPQPTDPSAREESQPSGSDENQEGEKEVVEEPPKPIEYTFYDDKDYALPSRRFLPQYKALKDIEDEVLKVKKENVKCYVICSGITYGQGESVFYELFKAAWLQEPAELPYLGDGENIIPTIHIADLAKFVIKVANAPPEENPYLLAFDDAKVRTQKSIIESISRGVGSGKVVSDEESEIIQPYKDIFRLDIDIRPSKLLVGTAEEPVQFEWTCRLGIQESSKKVLQQFCQTHKLRPLNVLIITSEAYKSGNTALYETVMSSLEKQYRTPILKIEQLLLEAKQQLTGDLKEDLEDEYLAILNYLNEKKPRALDETLKVLYRVVRWRLTQNDCACRGYIFENYPHFEEEIKNVFIPVSQSKLKRKVKKPKPVVAPPAPVIKEKEPHEDEESKPTDPDAPPEEAKAEQDKPPEAEPEPEPEPQPQPQAEQQGDKPKKQKFYPESVIKFHKLTNQKQQFINQVVSYFSQNGIQQLVYDTTDKHPTVIYESLRSYIERNGRPNNYLITEEKLFDEHKRYYSSLNQKRAEEKQKKIATEEQIRNKVREDREKIGKEVWGYIKEEGEQEIKKMPFRNYLMEFVVPILNEGLLEVSNIIPNDPVELLAEYLYQKSYDL